MTHPININGFENLESHAKAVGSLRYDAMAKHFRYISEDLYRQAEGDFKLKRYTLAIKGYQASFKARELHDKLLEMMGISRKHMKKELEKMPELQ